MSYGKITDKQREILEYIKAEILNRGYPPAVREICEAVKLKSTSSVHAHLETLEKNGYIRRDPTKPRAIEIVDENFNLTRREMVNVPIVGKVAAGEPILAVENIENYFPIPAEMVPSGDTFILKVKGDSMINAGIFNGDQIFVNCCNTAENGDTVVALIDDSATVKTYYKENYNDSMPFEYFNKNRKHYMMHPETMELLGKMLIMLKRYGEEDTLVYIRERILTGRYPKKTAVKS